ncbi:serine/threonine-protein phosphatase 7 long form-like protein [Senna tora]|uniref:Serine/threonine-protein phosphatase 7 long form-like protein n=1 Tax=Senna tora TaxID=362788 RepID=A0A835CKS7_9FABA|nr:serine/threonine-protein phosphatase 7 long form-like protein [Senna tora]
MAMRVRGFLYKNGSCLSGNDGLSFQVDRVEGVMLTDDMTLAQLKESIRGRLRMGRGEEICNVTYRMPMTLCPLRFGELNLCDDYFVAMMFESFRDNATNLNGVELLVQTVSSSIVEFDLNVSLVIDEGGSATVVACTQALANFTIEATNLDSAIIEVPPSNVCRRGSSSRRNPAVGESSRQRTAYVNEDEAARPPPRDPLAHIYQPLPPLAARWQGMFTTARPATSSHQMYRQMIDQMDECGDHSDRVLRQFGMTQPIPGPPRDLSGVHGLSLRNKSDQTWYERHKAWIDIWFQWPALVCTTSVAPTHLDRRSDYMQWYRRHTRRWIHPDSAAQGYAGDVADRTMSQASSRNQLYNNEDGVQKYERNS